MNFWNHCEDLDYEATTRDLFHILSEVLLQEKITFEQRDLPFALFPPLNFVSNWSESNVLEFSRVKTFMDNSVPSLRTVLGCLRLDIGWAVAIFQRQLNNTTHAVIFGYRLVDSDLDIVRQRWQGKN